jgi:hypothetical protein
MSNDHGSDEDRDDPRERALVPYAAPQETVFRGLFESNQNYLGHVSALVVQIQLVSLLDAERRFLSMVPVRRIKLGAQIGSGGTNSVHRIAYHGGGELEGMLMKDAGASGGFSREYNALRSMESIGLRSVARGVTQLDDKQMLVMDFIAGCVDSKSIIGYQRDLERYIDPDMEMPAPQQKFVSCVKPLTIRELIYGWERMTAKNKSYGDFQFLIDRQGNVIYNDPTSVDDRAPNKGTRVIIQAMIDTWEFAWSTLATGMSWGEFKRYKRREWQAKITYFGSVYRGRFTPPDFHIVDLGVFEGRSIASYPCLFFRGGAQRHVPHFDQVALSTGEVGYFTTTSISVMEALKTGIQNIQAIKSALNL